MATAAARKRKTPARAKPSARRRPAAKRAAPKRMPAKTAGAAPMTRAWAARLMKQVERIFESRDIPTIMKGYTDDVVVRFGATPELRGKAAVEKWLRERLGSYRDYKLKKTLKAVSGDVIGGVWEGAWTDARTGKKMRGRGAEFWTMRGDKCAVWEAALTAWEDDGKR